MRILVADDDGISRSLVTKMLQYFGYEVTLAQDGAHAWQLLQQANSPDFVILDWLMPEMDGVTVCKKLRAQDRDISPYIILLTGMSDSKNLIEGFNAGADDYMTKPFNPDELFVRVRAGERIINLQIECLSATNALKKQPSYDILTGLRNHDAILNELGAECEAASKNNQSLGLIKIDLDNLKSIIDAHGRKVADRVLSKVAARIVAEVRSHEIIGHCHDKEFLVILKGNDLANAEKLTERICNAITTRECDINGNKFTVTATVGTASSSQSAQPTANQLLEMVDVSLNRNRQTASVPADST